MPAEDPPVSATPPPVRVTRPRELLSLVPVLLGFYPRASVVVIGVMPPRGTVRVSLRFAGYDPADPGTAALGARFAAALLASLQCPQAAAVGYGPDQHVAPFFTLLREQAAQLGIELTELLRAEDGRYWSYACANPACCPPGGSPYDDTPDPALAPLLPEGVPAVLPGREALAGLAAPGYVAAPATLLAHAAWRAGNGALANVALDRALADDPGYPLARTLQRAVTAGAPPAKAQPPLSPRKVAIAYQARAAGTGRPALTAAAKPQTPTPSA